MMVDNLSYPVPADFNINPIEKIPQGQAFGTAVKMPLAYLYAILAMSGFHIQL